MQTFVRKKWLSFLTNICSSGMIYPYRTNVLFVTKELQGVNTDEKINDYDGTCCSLMNALADETELPESQKYYTSIEIQKGDTLWGIADEYAESCRMSTTDYVAELKSMNGLKEDVIHSGQHLTIMYCVPVTEVLAEK